VVGAAVDTVGFAAAAVGAAGFDEAVAWAAGAAGDVGLAAGGEVGLAAGGEVGLAAGADVGAGLAVGCACVLLAPELPLDVAAAAGAFPPSTRAALAGAPPVPTIMVLRDGRYRLVIRRVRSSPPSFGITRRTTVELNPACDPSTAMRCPLGSVGSHMRAHGHSRQIDNAAFSDRESHSPLKRGVTGKACGTAVDRLGYVDDCIWPVRSGSGFVHRCILATKAGPCKMLGP